MCHHTQGQILLYSHTCPIFHLYAPTQLLRTWNVKFYGLSILSFLPLTLRVDNSRTWYMLFLWTYNFTGQLYKKLLCTLSTFRLYRHKFAPTFGSGRLRLLHSPMWYGIYFTSAVIYPFFHWWPLLDTFQQGPCARTITAACVTSMSLCKPVQVFYNPAISTPSLHAARLALERTDSPSQISLALNLAHAWTRWLAWF